MENVTLAHVAIFLIGATWAFGGQADWVKLPLAWWGSLGVLITLTKLQDRDAWNDGWMRPLWWLWPIALFNVLVLIGSLNPSYRELKMGADIVLAAEPGVRAGLPTSVRPSEALHALWLFDAVWISCFNLALILRQRRAVRAILLIAGINAIVLAIFGTAQKLAKAPGLYFGTVPSPQVNFFSSFVYHNHWGSFAVLMLGTCLGLIWHYARRKDTRDFFHSPAFSGLIAVILLAAAIPLSNSRSCTVVATVLLGAAFVHWVLCLVQKRRRFRESIALPLAGAFATLVLACGAIWFVAKDSIVTRFAKTREQIEDIRERGADRNRAELYGNTWRMARDKPIFGWGMASYPYVFHRFYNTQQSVDGLPVFYNDAHSDWLQSFAEHGFVGSAVLGLCVIVPLLRLRRRHFTSAIPGYLLAGCGLVVLYAWLEFPFGNFAVILTWWLCFFSAVQYARLQDREAPPPTKTVAAGTP